jgi:predicted  nucleic acid-binding Zn-ribbon protein
VAALKSSMQALSDIEPLQDGLDALEAAVADAKTALDAAAASITAELQPAVQQVQTAFEALQTAVDGLNQDNLREQAPAIGAALQGLAAAVTSLTTSATQACPDS